MINEYLIKGDFNFFVKKASVQLFYVKNKSKNVGLCYETVGLKDRLGYEIQINLSLEPTDVDRILKEIITHLENGKVKAYNGLITSELTGSPIQVISKKSYVNDDEVYRLVFCDEDLKLPHEAGCDSRYINQLGDMICH